MALLISRFLTSKTYILSLSFRIIPSTSSLSFSSHCNRSSTTLPSLSTPPLAKKVPFTVSAHGYTWQDPYHWMRHTNDPDFLDYLSQENSYAESFMADTRELQRTLVREMRSRLPTKISTAPERWGPWLYYQYIPEGKEYPILCRRLETSNRDWMGMLCNFASGKNRREEILLDWNEIAERYGYVHVGTCRVSPDHNFLAYTLDINGSEQFMLQIKDLRNGYIIPRSQVEGVVSLAWATDGNALFYTLSDENQRPYKVLCKKLGSDEIDDVSVFTECDSSFCVDITSTKDGKFITVNSNSRTSSEVYVIDATSPLGGLQRVHERVSGVQYFLEHHCGFFYILTNAPLSEDRQWSGGNYYLARCQVENIQSPNWQDVILPSEDMSFSDMDIFNDHLVLFINKNGYPMLCSIHLPMETNCKMPDVVVDYDMSKRIVSIVHQEEVRGISGNPEFSPSYQLDASEHNDTEKNYQHIELWKDFSDAYYCERKEVISNDGVRVPLTILYSRKAWQRGQSPGLLHGYGAYGEVLDKSWCPDRLSLLDRGWVVAFADVRGGAGGGDSSWHKAGSGMSKYNSIYDFLSCGNYLVNQGYVDRDKLGAIGLSAGGLLVGAAINMNPDLFRAAILKVPFLDICNTLLDSSLPLTILDYEEFGDPRLQTQFEHIRSYSPYDNIPSSRCYPSMLVTASFHDSRVGVWEAAKWVARVRDTTCSSCSRSVILRTNMIGGHFGEGGCYVQHEETANDYAFLMKIMGNLNENK